MRSMGTAIAAICVLTASVCGALAQPAGTGVSGVVRLEPELDALVSSDAKLEKAIGGFGFTEGALWVPQRGGRGYLLFSDIPANVIYKWVPGADKATIHLDHSGYTGPDIWRVGFIQTNGKAKDDPRFEEFPMIGSNGLALDHQGRLIIATWSGRSIDRIEKNGKRTVLADRWQGKRFGGTNDVVVKRDGAIYFTDTYGGYRLREKDPKKELDFNAVYMLRDNKLSLLINDIPNTNGLAFSPDEKFLYVNGSRDRFLKRYEVAADGTLKNGHDADRHEQGSAARHHRRAPGRYPRQHLGDRSRRRLGDLAGGQASRHHPHAGACRQCRVRRCRPQDALHRGAHQHLQDPGQRAGNSVTKTMSL